MAKAALKATAAIVGGIAGLFLAVRLLTAFAKADASLVPYALKVKEERRLARQAGVLVPAAALRRSPPVPARENAAPLYEQAEAVLRATSEEGDLPSLRTLYGKPHLNTRDQATVRKWLTQYADGVRLAERAALLPHCDFGPEFDVARKGNTDRAIAAEICASLLLLRARSHEQAGQASVAEKDIRRARQVARHLQEDGRLIPLILAARVQQAVVQAIRGCAMRPRRGGESLSAAGVEEALAEAEQLTVRLATRSVFQNAMRHQVAKDETAIASDRLVPYDPSEDQFLDYNRLWRALARIDYTLRQREVCDGAESISLRYYREVDKVDADAARQDLLTHWRTLQRFEEQFEQEHRRVPQWSTPPPLTVLTRWALTLRTQAALTRETLRLLKSRGAPSALAAKTADPFAPGGGPLHLRRTPAGRLALYSVGRNGRDDGGPTVRRRREKSSGDDIGLTLNVPSMAPHP